MPAIIHTTAAMSARKIELTEQDYTEDDRGLVSASLQFVAKASDRSSVDAMFYTDAPPPVWPTYLDRGRLIGRNLFMQSRKLSEQNGLLMISALFLGGRERIVPPISSDFQSSVTEVNNSEPFDLVRTTQEIVNNVPLTRTWSYTGLRRGYTVVFVPLLTSMSFVRVGNIDSFTPTPPQGKDMYSLVSFESGSPRMGTNGELIYDRYPRQYFIDLLDNKPVVEERKAEALTPQVSMITVRYSFDV